MCEDGVTRALYVGSEYATIAEEYGIGIIGHRTTREGMSWRRRRIAWLSDREVADVRAEAKARAEARDTA